MNESYVTLQEADEYHASRESGAAWAALDTEAKRRRLLEASDYIDAAYRFRHTKTDPNQPRQFPRGGMRGIPNEVRLAVLALSGYADLPSLAGLKSRQRSSVKVGELEVRYSDNASGGLTDFWLIDRLLSPWIIDPNVKIGAITIGGGCV